MWRLINYSKSLIRPFLRQLCTPYLERNIDTKWTYRWLEISRRLVVVVLGSPFASTLNFSNETLNCRLKCFKRNIGVELCEKFEKANSLQSDKVRLFYR